MRSHYLPAFFAGMLLACTAALAHAETPLARLGQANDLYARGQYAEAAGAYETLRQEGQANAALYYNMGNAYYKNGQPGRAILNYLRAERLAPRDADIRANLAFLRQVIKEPAPPLFTTLLMTANHLANMNETAAVFSLLCVAFFACATLLLFRYHVRLLLAAAGLFCAFLLAGGLLLSKLSAETWTREAVIVSGPAEIRNGPGTENSVGFTLPEGRTVVILGENNGWEAVGLPADGLRGWTEKKYIEAL